MTLQEYLKAYPEAQESKKYLISCTSESGFANTKLITSGMLQFTQNTAHMWAGPFPGGFAYYTAEDFSKYKSHTGHVLQTEEQILSKAKQKGYPLIDNRSKDLIAIHFLNEYPTVEKPYRLYIAGNDDTSYSRNFATKHELLEFIELLETCQPLDAYKDIQSCFAFTN